MYNRTLIAERIATIQSSVKRLEELKQQYTLEEFVKNEDAIDIAENRLRKALEALFDLGRHVVVKSGMGVPGDYRAIIAKLSEGGVLPEDFAQRVFGMAGYRNRLIHEYNKILPEELYAILDKHLDDFLTFVKHIVAYIERGE